jgi:hypothetical protein
MKIVIFCHRDIIELILYKGKKIVDRIEFVEARQSSRKLLLAIDELLVRNKLKKIDIKNISVKGEMEKIYSARRIAEITAKTFNYAVKGSPRCNSNENSI